MKTYHFKNFFKSLLSILLLISLKSNLSIAENLFFEEIQIDSTTKKEDDSVLPTNPFEIVEMIRRNNSLNDATNPSEAIDDALKLFDKMDEKKEI
tara:strand:+ start:1088 stop:1372 length:285 start_codon:yes stop_codon:yes gene_type:complete